MTTPSGSPQPARWKIALKVPALLLWMGALALICASATLVSKRLGRPAPTRLYRLFHTGMAGLFQLTTKVTGQICLHPNTLYVANHASYLDVFVLGSLIDGSFIAKSEVAGWPVFGKLAGIQNTLFLTRKSTRAVSQVEQLATRLKAGRMVLFPEGTSTPGGHVEPFRSSLFAAGAQRNGPEPKIQPVTVAYTHYAGKPMSQPERDRYAWYLPMTFGPHFLAALGLQAAQTSVVFHPAVTLSAFDSRKECATHCEEQVRAGLLSALDATTETCPTDYRPLSRRWKLLHGAQATSHDTPEAAAL